MTSTKHFVIDPAGAKHSRTSKTRRYSHAVVARKSISWALQYADKIHDSDKRDFDFYKQMVAWSGVYGGIRKPYHCEATIERDLKNSQAVLDTYADRDAYAAGKRAERLAKIERDRADGVYDRFECLGWQSRYDLAAKMAAGTGSGTPWEQGVILEARIKG